MPVDASRARMDRRHSGGVPTIACSARKRSRPGGSLAAEPPLLLAADPGAALDIAQQWWMMQRLRARTPGGAALVLLHELSLASRCCDRLLMMERGRLVLQGPSQAVLADCTLDRI
ncbi:hypothetical protein BKE38_00195 [Pseudoroseomonas deserti]|uniref:Uncharacterized protein n=2 Tax=Teichococcus deserti TaxID=1817963 RepID=A0A1V2H9D3_9PROT|nr:hypothetical protein BKE38_00195 [Pseudoroseomonas deserti]